MEPNEGTTPARPKKKAKTSASQTDGKDEKWSDYATYRPEVLASNSPPAPESVTIEDSSKVGPPSAKKKRDNMGRNVGGWISPKFANELERSWLERDALPLKFDLPTYVPQIGDTVLYVLLPQRIWRKAFILTNVFCLLYPDTTPQPIVFSWKTTRILWELN